MGSVSLIVARMAENSAQVVRMALATFALLLGSSGCVAGIGDDPGIREGVVSERDGVPCFGVRDDAETRQEAPVVIEVRVYQREGGGSTRVWGSSYVPEPGEEEVRLPPGDCIAYAGDIEGTYGLHSGKAYVALISAVLLAGGRSHIRSYESFFCVVPEGDALRVQQIPSRAHRDLKAWEECGL